MGVVNHDEMKRSLMSLLHHKVVMNVYLKAENLGRIKKGNLRIKNSTKNIVVSGLIKLC